MYVFNFFLNQIKICHHTKNYIDLKNGNRYKCTYLNIHADRFISICLTNFKTLVSTLIIFYKIISLIRNQLARLVPTELKPVLKKQLSSSFKSPSYMRPYI